MWLFAFFLGLMVMLGACSSTNLSQVWSDRQYHNNSIQEVLVVSMAKQEGVRKSFEQTMSKEFAEKGVKGLMASNIFPEGQITPEQFSECFEKMGVDAILVAHLSDVRTEQEYVPGQTYAVPGYYRNFYGYYHQTYSYVQEPGYMQSVKVVNLELNLYEAKDGELIWTGLTETYDPSDVNVVIDEVSKETVKALEKEGFLRETK